MAYHDECPKCFGPHINPACKDCGHDVEDALREENARLRAAIRGALGTRPHNDFSPECEYERILRAALAPEVK